MLEFENYHLGNLRMSKNIKGEHNSAFPTETLSQSVIFAALRIFIPWPKKVIIDQ